MKHLFLYSALSCFLCHFAACDSNAPKEALTLIDQELRTTINRFDQELIEIDISHIKDGIKELDDKMLVFSDLYFDQILDTKSTSREEVVLDILTDTGYLKLNSVVQESFLERDLGQLNSEIAQGLENYIQVFDLPESAIPSIYTFISGFVYQSLVFEDAGKDGVAIGLEMFLGEAFPYKQTFPDNPMFSEYLVRTYKKEHVSKRIIEVLVEDKMSPPSKGDFLSLMIWGGKKLYVLDRILDFKSDTIVTEYTANQLVWCKNNEAEMWDYFFEKDVFYKTDMRSFSKLIGPAPTSPGMPPESPGSTGNYMGWQVIKAYMSRYPETSIAELLSLKDAQQILDDSKYKPRI